MVQATERKQRTITLTGRPPVKIYEDEWKTVAQSKDHRWDGEHEFQANEKWTDHLRVRLHADGRAIVSGTSEHDTSWQGRRGYSLRGGELLAAGADIPASVRRVADDLIERGGAEELRELAQECIADLPAEEL